MNLSSFGRALKITSNTARSYVDFLTESFIIRELQPFHTTTKKRLVKSPKYYYCDSGILHYLHRIGSIDQLIGHPLAGDSWEGYVIEEIYRKVRDDYELFFYCTQKGAEFSNSQPGQSCCQNPKLAVGKDGDGLQASWMYEEKQEFNH